MSKFPNLKRKYQTLAAFIIRAPSLRSRTCRASSWSAWTWGRCEPGWDEIVLREMGWLLLGTCVGLPPIFLTKLVKVWQTRVVTAMLAWEIVTLTDQGRSKITWIVRCSSKVATVEGSIGKWPIWGNCKWYRATLWKAPSLVCPWNWGLAQTKQQGYRPELHRAPTPTVPPHWGKWLNMQFV